MKAAQANPPAAPAQPAPAALAVKPSAPASVRAAAALTAAPAAVPLALTPETAAAVASLMPADYIPPELAPPVYDSRAWLPAAQPARLIPREGTTGKPVTLDCGPAPAGLTAVEAFLWPEMGHACARAVLWLSQWLATRRYMLACERAGCAFHDVTMMQKASPRFMGLYERAEAAVRSGRLARSEDTLHALANGDKPVIRRKLDAEGAVVETVIEKAPDTKALAMELGALDPQRYGGAGGKGAGAGGVVVNVVVNGLSGPFGAGAVDVSASEDIDYEAENEGET